MADTTRKRTSAALLRPDEQRAWIDAILESVDDALIGKRLDGTIVMWSAGAEKLYGYVPGEALGQHIDLILPEERRSELIPIFQRLRAGQPVEPYETVRRAKDGTRRDVSLTVSPVKDAEGQPIGAWAFARNIASQRRNEEQLRAAKEAAEQANLAKDRFLAVLSHELRTPLTPVITAVQLLSDRDDVPEDIRQSLRIIRRNVELESRLIDDLLDLTRISRGKLTLELETADAAALLEDAVEICEPALKNKVIDLELDCEAGQAVRGDAARLRQVFWNLLDNAAKFTPQGGTITARCAQDGDFVVIEVNDSGSGIEREQLSRIFDAFEQGVPSNVGRGKGLGLGLAICKALVAMHGGSVTAHSPGQGKGSTFRVRLPRGEGQPRAKRPTPEGTPRPAAVKGARILLVEDHEDTAVLMKGLLERSGHTVELAASVARGVERAQAWKPDLIVSDLGLPDGSGIDLLERVRAAGVDTPAIALSGYGMDDDLERTRGAGFVAHLVKPVGVKRLREAILEALHSR